MKTWQVRVVKMQETWVTVTGNTATEAQKASVVNIDWSTVPGEVNVFGMRLIDEPDSTKSPDSKAASTTVRKRTRARPAVTDAGPDN